MPSKRFSRIDDDSEEAQEGLKYIDEIFVAFLREKSGLGEKTRWLSEMRKNEQYVKILRERLNTTPEELAEAMGISVKKLYLLEQEIFRSYYADFHSIAKR